MSLVVAYNDSLTSWWFFLPPIHYHSEWHWFFVCIFTKLYKHSSCLYPIGLWMNASETECCTTPQNKHTRPTTTVNSDSSNNKYSLNTFIHNLFVFVALAALCISRMESVYQAAERDQMGKLEQTKKSPSVFQSTCMANASYTFAAKIYGWA